MKTIKDPRALTDAMTRRQAVAGMALALGSLAAASRARGDAEPAMKDTPASAENLKRTSIHQEIDFTAGPQRIYGALLDPKQFAAFTGLPAVIDPREGGAISLFGGLIEGRNVELVPGQRVVQAWRPTHWDPGIYSIARFELKPKGPGTTVVLDHTGFPEGEYDHLLAGWSRHYWVPLAKYLA
jgi:activator of HSP90 ATPase